MSQRTDQEISAILKKYKKRSQFGEVWHRMKRNKGAVIGLVIIITLILIAIFSSVLLNYEEQVIGISMKNQFQHPSWQHLMGTDRYGRDIFYRLLYGSRYSLMIGIISTCMALVVGVVLGAFAGFYGGKVETVIMRSSDILAAVPAILMAMVIVASLGSSLMNLMIAVAITNVPGFIRTTRASVLTIRHQEYIESARAIGLPEGRIIFGHVLPNGLSPIIVAASIRIAGAIIEASALSFLGLGVPQPAPEWGAMLSAGREFIRDYGYMTIFPGLAIMITVLAFNLVGDGLRDALDPKLK